LSDAHVPRELAHGQLDQHPLDRQQEALERERNLANEGSWLRTPLASIALQARR
jgi:two-component system sensor histidine kinase QseC